MKVSLLRAGLAGMVLLLIAVAAGARENRAAEIAVDALPPPALRTLDLIQRNGPFPFDRDGIVFGNRERLLPSRPRGYYHEYTVKMPGERSRGAVRIVCGGDQRAAKECYYTNDHYRTFRRIR